MSTIQTDIEARLAASEPDVEVLLAEIVGGSTVRLFIDHPDGVTLALCERVTKALPSCASATRSRSPRRGPSARSPSHSISTATSAAARGFVRGMPSTDTSRSPASSSARPTTP